MTRFSRLHPYPAMIADELASSICKANVRDGHVFVDPFCGTGRTVVGAAQQGARAFGIDVNPLALLITEAKCGNIRQKSLNEVEKRLKSELDSKQDVVPFNFEEGRKVRWYSKAARRELSAIIRVLNSVGLRRTERQLLSVVLSATSRDTSYCRKDQWKIHRLTEKERLSFRRSPIQVFIARLNYIRNEVNRSERLVGTCKVIQGTATHLPNLLSRSLSEESVDVVVTSPPYGDSRSTVQYGGISNLCLQVVSHVNNINLVDLDQVAIDKSCLGGQLNSRTPPHAKLDFRIGRFWKGPIETVEGRRMNSFLEEMASSCDGIYKMLKPGGKTIFIVGRRTVLAHELKLDSFIKFAMSKFGCSHLRTTKRKISGKMTPYAIHNRGNARVKHTRSHRVSTMREEYIIEIVKN